MKRMGKETRRMLCWLLAICMAAAAGSGLLLSYMTNDFQKTMVEHDYGTAGYLVNHPDTNVAAAFTRDKTDSDLKAGKQALKEAGYHENTDPRMVPAVAAYRKRTAVLFGGMLFCVFAAVFLTVWICKNNRISILCIMLSVCLVTAVFSMADMAVRSQKNYFIKTGGEYHAALHDVETETAEQISARVDVALSGWVYQGSTGMLSGKTVSFVGADEKTMESLTEMDMTDGIYPSLPDEALLNESAMEQLGLSIGDNMTVTVPDGSQKQYRITGTLADMGSMPGAVVGFLIVLLASLSPAKKASRVSPVTAVSGGSWLTQNKRAANTKLFHVETGMGVFHALSGKKNLFLMTCSFAVSIMLFLSFQVMVVFLDQGMPALAPWAGDVSVTAAAGLETSVIKEIAGMEGVKRAFGRMEYSGLSVSSDTESGTATLVSYEENQFKWAKEERNEGNTESVQAGTGDVLVTYRDGMQWNVGDIVTLHTPLGEKQVRIAGILSSTNASSEAGSLGYIICSEQMFTECIDMAGYTAVDIQLAGSGSDETVSAIRSLFPPDSTIADKRLSNSESQSSYYTGAVFIYGFLIIIALITVFNIFNSMNASVAARTRQYGMMRSIGMGAGQLYRMIAAEAATYAVLGCVTGCVLGLPLNKMMFQFLIAGKWGTSWQFPAASLLLIVLLCFGSAALAIRRPVKKIGKLSIVDTIKLQQ